MTGLARFPRSRLPTLFFVKISMSSCEISLHEKKKSLRKRVNGKNACILVKKIADFDYQNSKDTWKQIGSIFNLRKKKSRKSGNSKSGRVLQIF